MPAQPIETASNPTSPGPRGISEAELRAALREFAGVYSLAAKRLGCDRSNVWARVNRSPELLAFCEEIEAEVGDAAEAVIKNKIIAGDGQMARWYAEMKLKKRGYVRRVEASGPGGGPLQVAGALKVTVEYVEAPPDPGDVI